MVVDLAALVLTRYILPHNAVMLNIFRDIHAGPLPPLTSEETDLSQRLRKHVDMLARVIGPRNIIAQAHNLELAAAYIEKVFDSLKLSTGSQPYTVLILSLGGSFRD